MIELGMVLALLGSLVGGAALLSRAPWDWLIGGGTLVTGLGLLLGVPTGVWYHVRLYRALRARGVVASLWWLSPGKHHGFLSKEELRPVMRPFYAGAVGFVLAVLGCVLFGYGALRAPPG
jgi:hypothetical protein